VKNVKELVTRDILIIGGSRDQESILEVHVLPIFRALQSNGAEKLSIEIFDADHSFETVREALAQRVIAWIKERSYSPPKSLQRTWLSRTLQVAFCVCGHFGGCWVRRVSRHAAELRVASPAIEKKVNSYSSQREVELCC
jgi:hypothetical protein